MALQRTTARNAQLVTDAVRTFVGKPTALNAPRRAREGIVPAKAVDRTARPVA